MGLGYTPQDAIRFFSEEYNHLMSATKNSLLLWLMADHWDIYKVEGRGKLRDWQYLPLGVLRDINKVWSSGSDSVVFEARERYPAGGYTGNRLQIREGGYSIGRVMMWYDYKRSGGIRFLMVKPEEVSLFLRKEREFFQMRLDRLTGEDRGLVGFILNKGGSGLSREAELNNRIMLRRIAAKNFPVEYLRFLDYNERVKLRVLKIVKELDDAYRSWMISLGDSRKSFALGGTLSDCARLSLGLQEQIADELIKEQIDRGKLRYLMMLSSFEKADFLRDIIYNDRSIWMSTVRNERISLGDRMMMEAFYYNNMSLRRYAEDIRERIKGGDVSLVQVNSKLYWHLKLSGFEPVDGYGSREYFIRRGSSGQLDRVSVSVLEPDRYYDHVRGESGDLKRFIRQFMGSGGGEYGIQFDLFK